jgi:beta-N-acetylhexosaminidase
MDRFSLLAALLAATFFSFGCAEVEPEPVAYEAASAAPSRVLDSLFAAYAAAGFAPEEHDEAEAAAWVEETLAALSSREKVGQLFIVNLTARGGETRLRPAIRAIREQQVGGFLVPRLLAPGAVAAATDTLQQVSLAATGVPLFFAADYERGVGRFSNTFTELPSNMALGAAQDTTLAAVAGRISAIEARAIGVNLLFAPVVDVNNNPGNPIINIRSYGEEPALVGEMARAFVREAERYGLLTTLKHFPGHGNTTVDSHAEMGTVASTPEELSEIELRPYRTVFAGPVEPAAVMTAHLWIEALDDEQVPATLSPRAIDGLLRDSLGYDGVVITDDLKMGGVSREYPLAERVVRSIEAGADVLLTPGDLPAAKAAVLEALESGRLSQERLDESVRRILQRKARAGLYHDARPQPERLAFLMERAHGRGLAQAIADEAITLLRTGQAAPIAPGQRVAAIHLTNYRGSESIAAAAARFDELLGDSLIASRRLERAPTRQQRSRLLEAAREADVVVLGLYLRLVAGSGTAGLSRDQAAFVRELLALDTPVAFVTFGNPYAVDTFAESLADEDAIVVAYDQSIETINAVEGVLSGEAQATGTLPITLTTYPLRSSATAR